MKCSSAQKLLQKQKSRQGVLSGVRANLGILLTTCVVFIGRATRLRTNNKHSSMPLCLSLMGARLNNARQLVTEKYMLLLHLLIAAFCMKMEKQKSILRCEVTPAHIQTMENEQSPRTSDGHCIESSARWGFEYLSRGESMQTCSFMPILFDTCQAFQAAFKSSRPAP